MAKSLFKGFRFKQFSVQHDKCAMKVGTDSIAPGSWCEPGDAKQMVRVDLGTIVMEVPTQDVISRDNVSVKVNAVVYFRVVDSEKAIIQVEDYLAATSQLSQITLRPVLVQHELDDMLAEREQLNADTESILD